MKKRCALLIALFVFSIPAAWAEQISITLIHINDLHAHILPDRRTGNTGMAILSGFLKEQRRLDPDLLFLDAGDIVTGSAIDTLTRGEATYEIYDTLSPDAHVLGNHAFDHGLEVLFRNLSHARFPVVCANFPFSRKQRERILPYLIVERKGLRIAILGLTIRKQVKGIDPPEDPLETASRLQDKLKNEADLTIALTHLGAETDVTLAKRAPTLAIIVGGHSHTVLEQPRVVGNTYILQAGAFGAYVGKARFTFDTEQRRVTEFNASLVPLDKKYPPDPEVVDYVRKFYAGSDINLDEPLAEVDKDYSRTFVADLVAQKLWTRYRPEFSLEHPGGFRRSLAPGKLYRDDLYRIFPFDNVILKFSLPASALTESLFTARHKMWRNEPLLVSYPALNELRKYRRNREVTLVGSNYVASLLERLLRRTLVTQDLNMDERSILEQALVDRFPLKVPEARSARLWERWSPFQADVRGSHALSDAQ